MTINKTGSIPTIRHIALIFIIFLIASRISSKEIQAYISSLGLIVIPISLGFSWNLIYDKIKKNYQLKYTVDFHSIINWWMIGVIVLTMFCFFVSLVSPNFSLITGSIVSFLGIIFCILFGEKGVLLIKFSKNIFITMVILIIGILSAYLYLRNLSYFPLMLGSDFFDHLIDISAISNGVRGIHLFDDAFIILIEAASFLAGSKTLWMFWTGPLIQYFIMALGIYILANKILNNNYLSIFVSLIPLWFMGDGIINDLIFLLRRNIIMAMIPFLFLYFDFNDDMPKRKINILFIIAILVPILYYFLISNTFYISTISYLPYLLKIIIQPGFVLTSPSLTFDLPLARLQDLYVIIITSVIMYIIIKRCDHYEQNILIKWSIVSFTTILINYRMGILISILFFIFLILYNYFSNRIFYIVSVLALGVFLLLIQTNIFIFNYNFSEVFTSITKFIFQLNPEIWTLEQKIKFLLENYGQIYLYLTLFAIFYLSFAAIKMSKIISIINTMTIINLVLYFLPLPNSERFLVFITPFMVLIIMITFNDLIESYLTNRSTNQQDKHIYFERLFKITPIILLILLSSFNLTNSYDLNIQQYNIMYKTKESLSSFSDEDIQMANWIRNTLPKETLILSDPATIRIISGLSETYYTPKGRYFVNGLNTNSVVNGKTELFRNFLSAWDIESIITIQKLYNISDKIMGINSINRRTIAIINNRTTAWINGAPGYEYASSFQQFTGLTYLKNSSLSKSIYNISSHYFSYEITAPILTEINSTKLVVQYDDLNITTISTKKIYYDKNRANYTLTLSNAKNYLIKEIPKTWLFESIESPFYSGMIVSQSDNGAVLRIENSTPSQTIIIHWSDYSILGELKWKMIQWQNTWQLGPPSNMDVGQLNYSSADGTLSIFLDKGAPDGYSSIFRSDFFLPADNQTIFYLKAKATNNARIAIAFDLNNGHRLFLFNKTKNALFPLQSEYQMIETYPQLENSSKIVGFQIFLLSTDGQPCELKIKYIFTVSR